MKKSMQYILAVLALIMVCAVAVPCADVTAVYAAETGTEAKGTKADADEEQGPRLSVDKTLMNIYGEGFLRVTLRDRTEEEDVTVSLTKSSSGAVEKTAWFGDVLLVKIRADKTKAATFTATFGDEKVSVALNLKKGKKKSAEKVYDYMYDSMVEVKTVDSVGNVYIGSGFFIGDGEVITNYHVVECASKIVIRDYYGRKYAIEKILSYSAEDDLILIKVEGGNRSYLGFSGQVKGGERVYCMGSPLGLSASFTQGMVSNPSLTVDNLHCIQVSLPSGTGIGGAPIVNECGQVIGVMCLTVPDAQNMCFAIDFATVKKFIGRYQESDSLTLEEFYELHKWRTKESNDYWDGVVTDNIANSGKYSDEEMDSTEIYDLAYHAMVEIICIYGKYGEGGYSTGSGFFISEDTVVTNWHVIDNYSYLYIYDYDQNVYEMVSEPKYNKKSDMAMFTVESETGLDKHTCLEVQNGYIPQVGETIYTFGNPARYNATFAEGTVMFSNFVMDGYKHIAFSAPITEGSSGGALINKYGRVIGVTGIKLNNIENTGLAVRISYLGEL